MLKIDLTGLVYLVTGEQPLVVQAADRADATLRVLAALTHQGDERVQLPEARFPRSPHLQHLFHFSRHISGEHTFAQSTFACNQ